MYKIAVIPGDGTGPEVTVEAVKVMKAAAEIGILATQYKPTTIRIDTVGVGAGLYDRLKELKYPVQQFKAGWKPNEPKLVKGEDEQELYLYANLKAEVYWRFRLLLEAGLVDIPNDTLTKAQFASIKYELQSDKSIKVMGKKQMRKEGLGSPDRAEAIIMAFFGRELKARRGAVSNAAINAAMKN